MKNNELTWKQEREGYSIRHRLLGTSLSIVASGGSIVVGYGAHGRARRNGRRHYELFDGERHLGSRPTLTVAKAHVERRAQEQNS